MEGRRRIDRAALVPLAIVAAAVVLFGVLVATSRGGDDGAGPPPTAMDADEFTIEGVDGTLRFERDGDDAALEFEGPGGTGRFSFDLDGDGVVAEGEDGAFELTGEEPPGWPDDFPVPPGAEVVRGSVLGAESLTQLSTTYRSPRAPDRTVAFYREALADAAPIIDDASSAGIATISFEGAWHGFLTVQPADTPTSATVVVQLYVEGTGRSDEAG